MTRRSDPESFGQAAMEYSRRTPPSRSTRWICIESFLRDIGDRDLEIDPAMRASGVVVLDELFKHALEMTLVSNEQPVEALASCGAN